MKTPGCAGVNLVGNNRTSETFKWLLLNYSRGQRSNRKNRGMPSLIRCIPLFEMGFEENLRCLALFLGAVLRDIRIAQRDNHEQGQNNAAGTDCCGTVYNGLPLIASATISPSLREKYLFSFCDIP